MCVCIQHGWIVVWVIGIHSSELLLLLWLLLLVVCVHIRIQVHLARKGHVGPGIVVVNVVGSTVCMHHHLLLLLLLLLR
jgi:hypothetical protein